MGLPGCFNLLLSCASGTIRKRRKWRPTFILEQVALERLNGWLPKLSNPVRIGEHDQTAFGLGLMLDYALGGGDQKFAELVVSKSKQFYLNDKNLPSGLRTPGEDFLSPCLGEADLSGLPPVHTSERDWRR
jgi:DUF2891 family protein